MGASSCGKVPSQLGRLNRRQHKKIIMISIVVPARNESRVIARTLQAMTAGAAPGEIDLVVVCNGCTDNTAGIARSFGAPVRVIETEMGSKTVALNLGDQAALGFPRIYTDADVIVSIETIRALACRLARGDVLAVAPRSCINLNGCSWGVCAYYDVRSRLPSAREGIGGSGVYALSDAGRRRFGEFPNITADDGYVRIQFKPEERETLASANSIVFAPRTIKDLILIRTRAYYGTYELARRFPDLWSNRGESNHKSVASLLGSPSLWLKLLIYCYVNIAARYKATARLYTASFLWERDHTSRNAATAAPDIQGTQPR
jgi:glycosyltransferase involved in cell wall biosynthesis